MPGVFDVFWSVVITVFIAVWIGFFCILIWFYRNPERHPPKEKGVIVSPADGTVVYVKEVENGEIPHAMKSGKKIRLSELTKTDILDKDGYIIGVFMSALDVHINRAPTSGRVSFAKYTPGKFISMRNPRFELVNERNTIVIENDFLKIGVVQIASHVVRRIDSYVKTGSQVKIGERIGMIKLGSQVDLIIPKVPGLKITVDEGERVLAGETIVAKHTKSMKHVE